MLHTHQYGVAGVLVLGDGVAQVELHGRVVLHGLQQQAVQIGAVDGGVGRAVAAHRGLAQRQRGEHTAVHGAAHLQVLRKGGHSVQRRLQAPGLQATHGVGAQLHASAHLGKLHCALEEPHLPPGARGGQCGCQPTDAASGDQ
jgi:hypothetical protein